MARMRLSKREGAVKKRLGLQISGRPIRISENTSGVGAKSEKTRKARGQEGLLVGNASRHAR